MPKISNRNKGKLTERLNTTQTNFKVQLAVDTRPPSSKRRTGTKRRGSGPSTLILEGDDLMNELSDKNRELEEMDELLSEERATSAALTKRVAMLEKSKASGAGMCDLFKITRKPTKEDGSGGSRNFGKKLTALTISCLSEGVSAADVKKFCDALSEVCDMLPDEKNYAVPKSNWFVTQRTDLRKLLAYQCLSFVDDAAYLTLQFDETSLHGRKPGSLLVANEHGDSIVIGIETILGRTGEDLAEDMWTMLMNLTTLNVDDVPLSELILRKLRCLMTDRSRVQSAGNRHFLAKCNSHPAREGRAPVYAIICMMHCVSNCEVYLTSEMSDETKKVFGLVKVIFGNRQNQGKTRQLCSMSNHIIKAQTRTA